MESSEEDSGGSSDLEERLQQLFAEENDTDSFSDASASDREWKEALRATVETEIQYQVQLRLASEDIDQELEKRDSDTPPSQNLKLNLRDRRNSPKRKDATEQLPSNTNPQAVAEMVEKQESVTDDAVTRQRTLQMNYVKHKLNEKQTVYEYISRKYGTPMSQLQHLVFNGKYKCAPSSTDDDVRVKLGIDKRVKWPIECEITQSTPTHTTNEAQNRTPFGAGIGPLIGYERTKLQYTGPLKVVYDRLAEAQIEFENDLKFESKFESGNLQKAIQV